MGLKLANPVRQLTLTKFGGLYTESDQRDLPAGAAAQCWDVDFNIAGMGIRPGLSRALSSFSPPVGGTSDWLYVKSTRLLADVQQTLAENSAGSLYLENLTAEGTMTEFYSGILNNARAISANVSRREYVCLSDLIGGQDQPRQTDGTNFDRISQVGPGAGPSVPSVTATQYTIATITQPFPSKSIDSASWGSGINLFNAVPSGNNLFILSAVGVTTFTQGINVGDYIYISGMGTLEGLNPNGTYKVSSMGFYTDGDGTRQYIGVVTNLANGDFARGTAGGQYQKTQAVIQMLVPLPPQFAVVGQQITVSGNSVQDWNQVWTIQDTPTEAQLNITATSLTSNVATYDYSLVSGVPPGWQSGHIYNIGSEIVDENGSGHVWQVTTPGTSGATIPSFPASPSPGATITDGASPRQITWTYQSGQTMQATVFNCSNGNGVFNIQGKPIIFASPTTFRVAITSADVSSAAETGQAITGSGSVLIIDPGSVTAGTGNPGTDPLFGTGTGGTVDPVGDQITPGLRYAVLMFKTRNGYLTQASPPVPFYTTGSTATFTFTNLAIGPPNVIARVIAITAANAGIGGPYFYIPDDVTVTASSATLGVTQTINKTVVDDNTSTETGNLTITDDVLLNSVDITAEGNNRLQVRELGECVKVEQFSDRAFYIGERVKVDGFLNPSFDGGKFLATGVPTGWQTNIPFQQASFVQKKWAYVRTTTSSFAVTLDQTPTVGNTLVVAVGGNDNGNYSPAFPTSPIGWTSLASKSSTGGEASKVIIGNRTVQAGDTATLNFAGTTLFPQDAFVAVWELAGTPTITGAANNNLGAPSGTIPTAVISPAANSFVLLMFVLGGAITFTSVTPNPPYVFENTAIGASPVSAMNADAAAASFPSSAVTANYTGSPASTGLWAYATGISSTGFFGQVVDSPIVNTSLQLTNGSGGIINPTGTALASLLTLYQSAYETAFETPIIQPYTAYSVRVTAANQSGATSGSLVIELYSAATDASWQFIVPLTSMTAAVTEFIGPFNNPLWQPVPPDLELRVYPKDMPIGAQILIDRIEVFPTQTPYYENQVAVSYAEDYESIDRVTGSISTLQYTTEPIRNISKFVEDELYIATSQHVFAPAPTDSEPSGWNVREVSDKAGACGPLTQDGGPEFRLTADYNGVWIFDGSNHIKVSQDIQKIWDAIYRPSQATIWVKNDIQNQKFFVGVPLPTPNIWLPDAPSNPTPATPNVILMCSYLGSPSGREIAEGSPIHVSMFTGSLLWRDMDRKWTIWQIKSPMGDFINREDGSKEFWLGGTGTGQIYIAREVFEAEVTAFSITSNVVTVTADNSFVAGEKVVLHKLSVGTYLNAQVLTVNSAGLSGTQFTANFTHADVPLTVDSGTATNATDDGAVIDETYVPYCLADGKDEETLQLGSVRKLYDYASVLIEGAGKFNVTMYPETLSSPYHDTQPNFTLATPAINNTEVPLNETGNRLFIKVRADGVAGSNFSLKSMIVGVQPDPRLPLRGWNV